PLPRDPLRGRGMMRVVCVDATDGVLDLLERRERKQSVAGRQDVAETSLLRDDWPAASQVTRAPVAEPPAAQPDVLILRHRELTARVAHVLPVGVDVGRERQRIAYAPAVGEEQLSIVLFDAAQRELERLRRSARQLDELQKFKGLPPVIELPV